MITERRPDESLAEYAQRLRTGESEGAQPFDADLVPDAGDGTASPEEDEITLLLAGDSIVDAYVRWCGKMIPQVGSKRESIMVSCPNPLHPDRNPSAWVNLDKNTGNCALCGGFDQYDIFAWNTSGFDQATYRTDGTFPDMRRAMAVDLGYIVRRSAGGQDYLEPVAAPETPQEAPAAPETPREAPRAVLSLVPPPTEGLATIYDARPPIDWRNLLISSTFLRPWMEACSEDDLPEEFYFWLGLVALGCAVGNNVKLHDRFPVRANLLLCLTGPTGMGKSRATSTLTRLIEQAFPYRKGERGGVKVVPMPGSAEALVDSFSEPLYDPVDPNIITGYLPIRGIVKIDELSSLMGRAARIGNVVKPTLMELYDSAGRIALSSRGHGVVEAVDHFSQVIATTQPRAMRDMLSRADDDSGFLNRWVFATGIPKPPTSIGGAVIDVRPLADVLLSIRSWGAMERKIALDDDALQLWDDFFHSTLVPLKMDEDQSVFVRVDLLMKKLMLLFTIDKREPVVSYETVDKVLELWPYLKASYGTANDAVNSSVESDIEQAIYDAIWRCRQAQGKPPTKRDLTRAISQKIWQRVGAQAVYRQLDVMLKLELVREVAAPTTIKGGRTTFRYDLPAASE